MLVATGLAVALASALRAEAAPASLPPVIVSVVEAPGVPGAIVTHLLAEAAEIWRAAGVAFMWDRTAARSAVPDPRTPDTGAVVPSRLRVIVGNDTGVARDHRTPLGWIVFEGDHNPLQAHNCGEPGMSVLARSHRCSSALPSAGADSASPSSSEIFASSDKAPSIATTSC